MTSFQMECAQCYAPIVIPLEGGHVHISCPGCGADTWIDAFPALLRGAPQGRSSESLLVEDESSCFYHPSKKAVVPCDACGRFLCALCDIEMSGQHLCATCIETGVNKGKLKQLKKEHVYYDEIALTVAGVPLLLVWPTLITAPIALYIAIRYWKRPLSAAPRGRWRFVAAIILASLELLVWGVVGFLIIEDLLA